MKLFFSNLNRVLMSGITVFILVCVGFIYWVLEPLEQIPLWSLCLTILIAYLVCVVLYAMLSGKEIKVIYILPAVKTIILRADKIYFIVESTDIYSINSLVSIYYSQSDGLETFLGLGYVETINAKGNMQIIFIRPHDNSAASLEEITCNIKKTVKLIKIKPTISKDYITEDKEYE